MSNDTKLLRQYVEERSERSFTELVQEHVNLVYSAALRETNGDGAQAEDVSQAVFTELARKAPRLLGHPSLAGWLYTTVRHMAANWRRGDQHRRRREEEAQSMNELLSDDSPNEAWQRIQPVLDDALHELKEADREALVLRFLEDRPLREVGTRLGLKENAARMRVTGRWTNSAGCWRDAVSPRPPPVWLPRWRSASSLRPRQLWRRPSPAPHWPAERLPVQPP